MTSPTVHTVPPSCNWYCDCAASVLTRLDGGDEERRLIAYTAARSAVVFMDCTSAPLRVLAILPASSHPNRVTGLAFNTQGTLLATSCSDGCVRLWNTATRQRRALLSCAVTATGAVAATSSKRKRKRGGAHQGSDVMEAVCVDWAADVIVCGTSTGVLIAWECSDSTPKPTCVEAEGSFGAVTCIKAVALEMRVVAARGYRCGVVSLVDCSSKCTVFKVNTLHTLLC